MKRKETVREFIRRRAVELLDKGETPGTIAHVLGVSTASINKWYKIYCNGGDLKDPSLSGRPRRLSDAQLEELRGLLLRGATAFGECLKPKTLPVIASPLGRSNLPSCREGLLRR